MNGLLAVLLPIALINSLSTLPGGLSGVVMSLGTERPYATASAFIAGKLVTYFVFGLVMVMGLDAAFDQANAWMQDKWQDPDTLDVVLQLLIGATMAVFGFRLTNADLHQPIRKPSASMTPGGAFWLAAGVSIAGLPVALLYFAAIDQILRADVTALGVVTALLYYKLIVLSPLILMIPMHRLLGARSDPIFSALGRFLERWVKRLMFVGFLCLGSVLAADAIGWFLGFRMLPT
jgi:Flp pilus assembly pilin Flp